MTKPYKIIKYHPDHIFYDGDNDYGLFFYPTKYYIAGIQGSHSEIWLDITTITKTIIFRLPPYEDIVQICKDHYSRVPEIANRESNIRSAPNEIKLIRYLMEIEDL